MTSAPPAASERTLFELELELLLEALYRRYNHDFRGYTRTTLRRRLQSARRHFEGDSLSQLQHRVLREPGSVAELLRFLTVQVSDLFRDPSFYAALRANRRKNTYFDNARLVGLLADAGIDVG